MIMTIKHNIQISELNKLINLIRADGYPYELDNKNDNYLLTIKGDTNNINSDSLYTFPEVININESNPSYKLVSRAFHPEDTVVDVCGIKIGGNESLKIIAGPCAVESENQIKTIAKMVKESGADILRGGAFKGRTSPYFFQGLELEGLKLLHEAGIINNIPVVSEIMSADMIGEFEKYVDLIQVGTRNMQNYALLKALGHTNKPILLKRGFCNTIEEWLLSAEYIMKEGNKNIILCERGIRTISEMTRNTLDISAVPIIKKISHLPIIVDPSHATGDSEIVDSVSLAAVAAGCDGLLIEVHNHPKYALSDGKQSIKPDKLKEIVKTSKKIEQIINGEIKNESKNISDNG
ncbi:MAG: 3-deoxy-7-phosphoheptulonate synthase [Bacilli bacterium]